MNTDDDSTVITTPKAGSSLVSKVKNANLLIVGILLVLAVFISGGRQFATKYYGDITGNIQENYTAIANQNEPSFILFREKLTEEGIKPDISEMTVFIITEAAFKYRWKRGEDERIYVVRRNSQGTWDTYLQ